MEITEIGTRNKLNHFCVSLREALTKVVVSICATFRYQKFILDLLKGLILFGCFVPLIITCLKLFLEPCSTSLFIYFFYSSSCLEKLKCVGLIQFNTTESYKSENSPDAFETSQL